MYNLLKTKIGNKVKKKINLKYMYSMLFFIKIVHANFVRWDNTSYVRLSVQKLPS